MKKKMYDYLVMYTFNAEGYLTPCTGSVQISRIKKITTFEELNKTTEFITNQISANSSMKISNLSINNFILLGRNKH